MKAKSSEALLRGGEGCSQGTRRLAGEMCPVGAAFGSGLSPGWQMSGKRRGKSRGGRSLLRLSPALSSALSREGPSIIISQLSHDRGASPQALGCYRQAVGNGTGNLHLTRLTAVSGVAQRHIHIFWTIREDAHTHLLAERHRFSRQLNKTN